MVRGWNFEGTSLRAVVSSVPSVELPIPVMQSLIFSSCALHTYRQGLRGCLLEREGSEREKERREEDQIGFVIYDGNIHRGSSLHLVMIRQRERVRERTRTRKL